MYYVRGPRPKQTSDLNRSLLHQPHHWGQKEAHTVTPVFPVRPRRYEINVEFKKKKKVSKIPLVYNERQKPGATLSQIFAHLPCFCPILPGHPPSSHLPEEPSYAAPTLTLSTSAPRYSLLALKVPKAFSPNFNSPLHPFWSPIGLKLEKETHP